jgi:lipopolysaccharide/colanic/teichoic acid biosynthesis glycosyltransferase
MENFFMLKHLFDIAFSFIGLLFLAPLFLVIAILIKCEDEGPVFYRGVRVGRNGKPFRIFKFRTMVME